MTRKGGTERIVSVSTQRYTLVIDVLNEGKRKEEMEDRKKKKKEKYLLPPE